VKGKIGYLSPPQSALEAALKHHLDKECCMMHEYFLTKVIQFYETHIVRHSQMIVGLPYSCKTTAVRTLKRALTDLAIAGTMHPDCIVHEAGVERYIR
jgi:dynein heavy chain